MMRMGEWEYGYLGYHGWRTDDNLTNGKAKSILWDREKKLNFDFSQLAKNRQ